MQYSSLQNMLHSGDRCIYSWYGAAADHTNGNCMLKNAHLINMLDYE